MRLSWNDSNISFAHLFTVELEAGYASMVENDVIKETSKCR